LRFTEQTDSSHPAIVAVTIGQKPMARRAEIPQTNIFLSQTNRSSILRIKTLASEFKFSHPPIVPTGGLIYSALDDKNGEDTGGVES